MKMTRNKLKKQFLVPFQTYRSLILLAVVLATCGRASLAGEVTFRRTSLTTASARFGKARLRCRQVPIRLMIRVASGQVDSGLVTTFITDRAIRFDFDQTRKDAESGFGKDSQ